MLKAIHKNERMSFSVNTVRIWGKNITSLIYILYQKNTKTKNSNFSLENKLNNGKRLPNMVENEEKSTKKPKKKYVFNCTKCGKCCEERTQVPVTTHDIKKWSKKGTLASLMPYLDLHVVPQQATLLVLKSPDDEKGCPLYDGENKLCNIYSEMPDVCQAFPLSYNGTKYFIDNFNKQVNCPGIGNGTMTKTQLLEDRKAAENAFHNLNDSMMLTTIYYSLIIRHLQKEQERRFNEMPEEERKKYEELLKKEQQQTADESKQPEGKN